jgi:antitoxin component YwqK of YwqJK toxin-antitoxin module
MVSEQNRRRINYDDLYLEDNMRYTFGGKVFTGIAFELYEDGSLRVEDTMVDGINEGASDQYFRSGRLQSKEQLHQRSLHGLCRYWYESGQLRAEKLYEHGVLIEDRVWNEDGKLVKDYQLGPDDPMAVILYSIRQKFAGEGFKQSGDE